MSSCKPLCAIFLRGVASLSQLTLETQCAVFVAKIGERLPYYPLKWTAISVQLCYIVLTIVLHLYFLRKEIR